ncbi:MAG: class I mannose-6-phosphate isomerase [Bryobacterales bacterium]|nr:class I mannose-6-phosphate isomerase [Bryobacterales bacterium]
MIEPLRLEPVFHDRVWGVAGVQPGRVVGEAWYTTPANRTSQGTLAEVAERLGPALFGGPAECPLLFKHLSTSARLSVQVHPDDEAARARHGCAGKTEAWYVLEAAPDATVALGLKRVAGEAEVRAALAEGWIEELLDWRPAKAGDVFLVPAGTIHALGAGLRVAEIQQNSDITYRLYDYGRPREMHVDAGLAVAELGPYRLPNVPREVLPGRVERAACAYFTLEEWTMGAGVLHRAGGGGFQIVSVIAGEVRLGACEACAGEVWLIPAGSEALGVGGPGSILVASPVS